MYQDYSDQSKETTMTDDSADRLICRNTSCVCVIDTFEPRGWT